MGIVDQGPDGVAAKEKSRLSAQSGMARPEHDCARVSSERNARGSGNYRPGPE
jgi:hypothetical protein